jgi:hypothetical protein
MLVWRIFLSLSADVAAELGSAARRRNCTHAYARDGSARRPGATWGLEMPLIYNRILSHFSGLNSVALNGTGDLAAVCFNDRELHVYHLIEGSRKIDPSKIVNPNIGGLEEGSSLEEYRFHRLSMCRYNMPADVKVRFDDTKLAFLNDQILLVAREIEALGENSPPQEKRPHLSLAAVKIETGDVVAEFTDLEYGPLVAAPLLIPPKYVLFPAGNTAICVDTTTFREVFRLRAFDEKGIIGEPESSGGEQICHNAVAYDPTTSTLYVLWREWVNTFLQTYRLHPDQGSFERLQRRPVLEDLEGNSMCLRADGKEVAVWATTMDETIDCRTEQCLKIPESARLGRLGVFSQEGDRLFDVHSKIDLHPWRRCDFLISSAYSYDKDGGATEIGIRFGVDNYAAKPFYLDDHTVVINTPGGALIGVDTISGKVERLMEEFSPIQDLSVHPQKRLLLVGTKGSANALSALNVLGLYGGSKGGTAF